MTDENDPLFKYTQAMDSARDGIEGQGYPYTFEWVGTEDGIVWQLRWWTPNLTADEADRILNDYDDPYDPLTWDEALRDMNEPGEGGGVTPDVT